jgi:hypothetical protein
MTGIAWHGRLSRVQDRLSLVQGAAHPNRIQGNHTARKGMATA